MIRLATRTDLAKLIPPGGILAELGVYRGQFAQKLCDHARAKKLVLVDRWEDGPDFVAKVPAAEALAEVRRRFGDNPLVEICRSDALHWLSQQGDNTLDAIYLDDDHSHDHVALELRWAFDKLKPGGWLMEHDYCAALPAVVWAVDGFCLEFGQQIRYLTNEPRRYRVWPRLPWQPRHTAYLSYGIVVDKSGRKSHS